MLVGFTDSPFDTTGSLDKKSACILTAGERCCVGEQTSGRAGVAALSLRSLEDDDGGGG